jgi:hypothetical protein
MQNYLDWFNFMSYDIHGVCCILYFRHNLITVVGLRLIRTF